ncbi:helix-turn-helix domain-containing protein [Streptomyces sp. NPDC048255]|uniref:helix-turn-helix domain-containing protein n=1 Tax=Streptomyces sp. NPDC048255 TaxID=3154713 RepID=UPI003410CB08
MEEGEVADISAGELVPRPRGPRTMVFQKDVDRDEVGDERHALAVTLRSLAQRVGVSLNRYSARVHWDRSTLSRYFSGVLVPPAGFVEQLIDDGNRNLEVVLTPEATAAIRRLHRNALRATSPAAADLQDLRDQLAAADHESELLQQEANLVREVLASATTRAKEQEAKFRSLEHQAISARITHRAELAQWKDDYESVQAERDKLRELVCRLERELREADRRATEAEGRCAELEATLETAEEAAGEAEKVASQAEEAVGDAAEVSQPKEQSDSDNAASPGSDSPFSSNTLSLGFAQYMGSRLTELLVDQQPKRLTNRNLNQLRSMPGVFMLYKDSELVYVGKDERSIAIRLRNLRMKLQGRMQIDLDIFSFAHVFVEDDMQAIAPEKLILKQMRSMGSIPWNGNGFGNLDPGRSRDFTRLKQSHFDVLYPIDLNYPIRFNGPSKNVPLQQLATLLKENLPYNFRSSLPPAGTEDKNVLLPHGVLTADQCFRLMAQTLGRSWQITALLGYVVAYNEKNFSYPSATRYYTGREITDVQPELL